MKKNLLKAGLLLLVIAPCVYLFYHFDLDVHLATRQQAIEFISSFGPGSIPVFMLLQAVQVVIAPIPGDVTGFIGGYLYGTVLGTVYSTAGLTVGSWLAFYLGRLYGLPLIERIVRPEIIQKYDYFMAHKGIGVSLAFFLIPGFPKDALCYIIGLSHMRTRVFLLLSTAGRLLGTILLSVAGSSMRQQHNGVFLIAAGALVMLGLLAWLYHDRLHSFFKKTDR